MYNSFCHLKIGLGYSVTVPENNLKDKVLPIFSVVKPKYGKILKYPNPTNRSLVCFNDIKKPKEINYWVSNPTTILGLGLGLDVISK